MMADHIPLLNKPTLADVLEELACVEDKWQDIGIQLYLDDKALIEIEKKYVDSHDSRSQLRDMIRLWLSGSSCCWEDMVNALRRKCVDETKLADKLKSKYCVHGAVGEMSMKTIEPKKKVMDLTGCDSFSPSAVLSSGIKSPYCEPSTSQATSKSLKSDFQGSAKKRSRFDSIELVGPSPKNHKTTDRPLPSDQRVFSDEFQEPTSFGDNDCAGKQPSDRKCTICNRLPRKPKRCTYRNCNLLYCEPCSLKSACQKDHLASFTSDSDLKSKIPKLKVYCKNRKKNCTWKGEVYKLKEHLLMECKIPCTFKSYGCNKKVTNASIKDHLESLAVEHAKMLKQNKQRTYIHSRS